MEGSNHGERTEGRRGREDCSRALAMVEDFVSGLTRHVLLRQQKKRVNAVWSKGRVLCIHAYITACSTVCDQYICC